MIILVEENENTNLKISIIREKKKDLKYKTFIWLNLIIINNHRLKINILIEIRSKLSVLNIVIILLIFNVIIIIINIKKAFIKDTLNGENKNIEDRNNNFIISKRSYFIIYSIKIVLFFRHLATLKPYLKFFE